MCPRVNTMIGSPGNPPGCPLCWDWALTDSDCSSGTCGVLTSPATLFPPLASNLGYLAAPTQTIALPTSVLTEGQDHERSRRPMLFGNILRFPPKFSYSGISELVCIKATQHLSQEAYLLLSLKTLMQLKICPSPPLILYSPFFSDSVLGYQNAEYLADNRCKDERNEITRISGSKLTLFCQESCEWMY